MNMNERERMTQRPVDGTLNDPVDPAGLSPGLTEEEAARLLALLAEAYPSPKKDIRAAVMERIRADKAQSRILPVADSQRRDEPARGVRWGRIAKWGALAACLVLVTAAGVKFLPALTRDLAVEKNAAAAYDMAAVEMADAEAVEEAYEIPAEAVADAPAAEEKAIEGGWSFTSAAPKSAEAPAPEPAAEPAAMYEDMYRAEEAVEEECAVECEEDALASYDVSHDTGVESPAMPESALGASMVAEGYGGAGNVPIMTAPSDADWLNGERNTGAALPHDYVQTDCEHAHAYRNAYHDIPAVLIERVGAEAFDAWASEARADDPCGVNILSFALRFGWTKEDIYAVGDVWYYYDLPEDLALTEENAAAIEEYYIAGGDPEKMAARGAVYDLKTALIREAGLANYLAWRGDGESNALRSWTIREGAAALGIGDARLAELARTCGCDESQFDE